MGGRLLVFRVRLSFDMDLWHIKNSSVVLYKKKTNLGLIPIRWQLGHVQKLGFEILYKFHVKTSSMTSE